MARPVSGQSGVDVDWEPDSSQPAELFQQAEDGLARLPGVRGVASANVPLLAGTNRGRSVYVEGFHAGPDVDTGSRYNDVSPAYHATMGIPVGSSSSERTPSAGSCRDAATTR